MVEMENYSVVVPNTSTESHGVIHRHFDPLRGPELHYYGCQTLYEAFRRGVSLNPLGPCLGYRPVKDDGAAGPYVYFTYSEVLTRINAFCAGLDSMGLVSRNSDDMLLLGVFMKNCPEWLIAEHGIYSIGGATVPLYSTLGPDSMEYIIQETEIETVVCTRVEVPALCRLKQAGKCPLLQNVIVVGGRGDESLVKEGISLRWVNFATVEMIGAQQIATKGHKHQPPSPDDIFTLCYTSGTTGTPKGALLSHRNLLAAVAGRRDYVPVTIQDRHLSFLPLPHIYERLKMCQTYSAGASIAFTRGDPLLLLEDMRASRPTLLAAVPRVLNKIYDKIHAEVSTKGGSQKNIFDLAVRTKTKNLLAKGQLRHAIFDKLVFHKLKVALGLQDVRLVVSGSAPLSPQVLIFFRILLGVPVIEGYGQTEGAGVTSNAPPEDMKSVGHVGIPNAALDIALANVPEMGYSPTDTLHMGTPCDGRGEVWIRGPSVFRGYYKQPEKTKETLTEEGWLKTGDIALWTKAGRLQLIDRRKNIFKLSQGEYVAPEKVENTLIQSLLVAQAFVYGDSLQDSVVAVVVPDMLVVRRVLVRLGEEKLSKAHLHELCRHPKLQRLLQEEIERVGKHSGLNSYEIPKAIILESEPMSVNNGLLTPTFKLKRQEAIQKYKREIEEMYSRIPKQPRSSL
eukprot:Nitzschia sp. Nitz4//scaffold355_size15944//9595//11783//NITZ4_008867-RA/size15944-processed-gene-0.17-mRNA-1//1//CDS//3329548948//1642//frame0